MNQIKDSLQKMFRWDAYWTYDDDEVLSSYNEKVGKTIPITVFSMKGGVVVLIPDMDNATVAFRKRTDGSISTPRFLRGGPAFAESFKGDKLLGIAKSLGDWKVFVEFSQGGVFDYRPYRDQLHVPDEIKRQIDVHKDTVHLPVVLSEDQMKKYIERNRDSLEYCEVGSEIGLLPMAPMTYDPMTERKRMLLSEIEKESIKLAEIMLNKRGSVTVTIPNFNINDGRILVLLEQQDGEAYTMDLFLDDGKPDSPVEYAGTFEIRSSPRYGMPTKADARVKRQALKVLKYKL